MQCQRRLDALMKECRDLGISVVPVKKKIGKKDCILALRDYYLKEKYITSYRTELNDSQINVVSIPEHLKYMMDLDTPMLCFRYNDMTEEFKKTVWEDPNWVAEDKINGIRMIFIYDKEYGIKFYSRNISLKDYLPIEYKNIRVPRFDLDKLTKLGVDSFVIDSEILCPENKVDTTSSQLSSGGVVTETNLSATTALLALNDEDSLRIQEQNNIELEFYFIHLLALNGTDFKNITWKNMTRCAQLLLPKLNEVGLPVRDVRRVETGKQGFYRSIIDSEGEGVILKKINSTYKNTDSRHHRMWIKVKRSMSETLQNEGIGDTLDGYVTGFIPGTKNTGFENLVGALQISINLVDGQGNCVEHHIANLPNMVLAERQEMTEMVGGKPVLKKEYYGRVVEMDGQWISARSKRLVHPVFKRWRPDRSPESCQIDKSILDSMVL